MADIYLELHDTKITNISWLGDTATLSLLVYLYRSECKDGIETGREWTQQADLLS